MMTTTATATATVVPVDVHRPPFSLTPIHRPKTPSPLRRRA
jgi:hypothetical protein